MTDIDLKSYTKVINKETSRKKKEVYHHILLKNATKFLMREMYLNDSSYEKTEFVLRNTKSYTTVYRVADRLISRG